jgi:hypothetical protein
MGTHLDITRRKQAELDREQLIERLARALAEIKTLRGIIMKGWVPPSAPRRPGSS